MPTNPEFTKPVDVQAYFYTTFGACGCSELGEMIKVVRDLLEWINGSMDGDSVHYDTLFSGNVGVYYLLVGVMDNAGICEHGTSIRFPWLTPTGEKLLKALQTFPAEEIENASGIAYDGIDY